MHALRKLGSLFRLSFVGHTIALSHKLCATLDKLILECVEAVECGLHLSKIHLGFSLEV